MRAIIGAELRKNVLHVRLHGGFGQVELIGNDLVGGACRDTAKYLDLTFGEDIVCNVLCKFSRDFGRDAALARCTARMASTRSVRSDVLSM